MNTRLIYRYLLSAGYLLSRLPGKSAIIPSHLEPWKDLSAEERGDVTCDEKYRYALKRTLDLIWTLKCYIFDAEKYHNRLQAKDGTEIKNITRSFKEMNSLLTVLADRVSRVLINRDINPWDRIHPLNTTIIEKLGKYWREIKANIDQYEPSKEAREEYDKICTAADGALRELPERYKPIYELVLKVQNQTYISHEARVKLAARGLSPFAD